MCFLSIYLSWECFFSKLDLQHNVISLLEKKSFQVKITYIGNYNNYTRKWTNATRSFSLTDLIHRVKKILIFLKWFIRSQKFGHSINIFLHAFLKIVIDDALKIFPHLRTYFTSLMEFGFPTGFLGRNSICSPYHAVWIQSLRLVAIDFLSMS